MKCNQDKCEDEASYRFTWPGRDEAGICEGHVSWLKNIAHAMGLPLQVIPLAGRNQPTTLRPR